MFSLMLAAAVLAGSQTPANGGGHGSAGFQPYNSAPPAQPHGLAYAPGFQPIQPTFAVPVVGGAAWSQHPYPPYPPAVNPWGWGAGGTYSPSPGVPPMKRIEEDVKPPKGDGTLKTRLPATVVVLAARDVVLTMNGTRLKRTADRETFRTPDLESGGRYSYEVVATVERDGVPLREARSIEVEPGRRTEIDLRGFGVARKRAAEVTIIVPEGASVRVNGQAVAVKGKQTFRTPDLRPGQKYHYEIEVRRTGKTAVEKRKVSIEPGKPVTVDFTRAKE